MKNKILTTIAILVVVWCFASYHNTIVNIDNQTYTYAWWNVIAIIFGQEEKYELYSKWNTNDKRTVNSKSA